MALVECGECKAAISSSAITCPSCSYPVAAQRIVQVARGAGSRLVNLATGVPAAEVDGALIDSKDLEDIFQKMKPAKRPPTLWRVNGIGLHMGSPLPVLRIDGKLVAVSSMFVTVFYVPVAMLGWHVVAIVGAAYSAIGHAYRDMIFMGRIDGSTVRRIFGSGVLWTSWFREICSGAWMIAMLALIIVLVAAVAIGVRGY